MEIKQFIYHENNLEKPFLPQEDFFAHHENIFVVADGITHDLIDNFYPNPSDAAEVAKIICTTFIDELKNTNRELEDIKKSLPKVNNAVLEFNKNSNLYKNRENNGYTIGAAVFALIIIKKDKLIYAVLDDCFFSIFSEKLIDHPILNSYVENSALYVNKNYDLSKPEDKKVWRKDYRNHKVKVENKYLGYGALDGSNGYEDFVQYGEEKLINNDLICLYTDGFIENMKSLEFIKTLKENEFSMKTIVYISKFTKENNIAKEKSCYFIKYNSNDQKYLLEKLIEKYENELRDMF